MMSKYSKRERNKARKEKRSVLEYKCKRCGNALPAGQVLCESCAELWNAQSDKDFQDDDPHEDFRARPGVTNDQLRDGFPRP